MSYMLAVTLIGVDAGSRETSSVHHTKLLPLSEHSMFVQDMMTRPLNPSLNDLGLDSEILYTLKT